MLRPETFIQQCKDAGFEPARAMMLYSELRLFGSHQVQASEVPSLEFFSILSKHAMADLENIKTPADFDSYCTSWKARFDLALKEFGKGMGAVFPGTFNIIERPALLERASGRFGVSLPAKWQDWADQGMEWEDLEAVLEANRLDLSRHATTALPSDVTEAAAHQRLSESVRRAGLSMLQWPWVQGSAAEQAWALADQVDAAADEMAKKTGWGPGALGLEGRVFLRLGLADPAEASGWCCDWSEQTQMIETSPKTGWGPVAHEWMHAVDHVLHRTGHPEALQAWGRVHEDLDQAAWENEDRQTMVALMDAVLEESWKDRPSALAVLQELKQAPTLTAADEQRLGEAMAKDCIAHNDVERADVRTVLALTEIRLIREGLSDPSSLWTRYGQTFSVLAQQKLPAQRAADWKDYFTDPAERVTHSFEATFPKNSITSDVELNASLRYPLQPEVRQHELAWKRFFRSATGWRESLKPASTPDISSDFEGMSLAARRRQRKEVGPVTTAATPSSPPSFIPG